MSYLNLLCLLTCVHATYICVYVCMYACMYVCMHVCMYGLPPVHPAVIGYLAFAGMQIQGLSHEIAMVQVGLRVPTPLAVMKVLFSCECLARLQELCLHGSQCLLSAQASWLCQVLITASGCKRICKKKVYVCMCMYVCMYVCTLGVPSRSIVLEDRKS